MKNNLIKCLSVCVMTIMFVSCSITLPVTATSNSVGSKVGKSSATVVLGFAFNEDASIRTAAKQGGISKISTVDIKVKNILGLVVTYETIITGE
jgi:hypothetical protein